MTRQEVFELIYSLRELKEDNPEGFKMILKELRDRAKKNSHK